MAVSLYGSGPFHMTVCVYLNLLAFSDFKPKRSSRDSCTQGRVTPLVGDHKVEYTYVPKSRASMFSLPTKSRHTSDINFYHSHEPYYCFTNFSQYPIRLDGKLWPTTEHYFQAQKFIGTPYEEAIRKQPNPRGAFDMSRDPIVSRWKRGDWDRVKDDIMLKCLRAKFAQHKDLKDKLLDTGDRKLIEHTFNDSYWGDGGDGSGQNKLGKLLMQVRKEISNQVHQSQGKFPDQSSVDHEKSGKKAHRKKHRRRNSISGISITSTVAVGSLVSTQPALNSKQKFRSTENLHHPHRSTTEKDIPSLSYAYGRLTNSLLPPDQPTVHKPTFKRWSSLTDLRHQSSSKYSSNCNSTDYDYEKIFKNTGKYISRTNQSSVPYNIINNT